MTNVLGPLPTHMMRAVDLKDEPFTDQQVDAVTVEEGLRQKAHLHPPKTEDDDALQAGIGEGLHLVEKRPGTAGQGQSGERLRGCHLLVECRFPDDHGFFAGYARGNEDEHVLHRVHQRIRMPRHDGMRSVNARTGRHLHATGVRRRRDVRPAGPGDPEAEMLGSAQTGDHDAPASGRAQRRIGIR